MVLKDKGLRKKHSFGIDVHTAKNARLNMCFLALGKDGELFLCSLPKEKAQESYCALLAKEFSEVDKSNFHWRQILDAHL